MANFDRAPHSPPLGLDDDYELLAELRRTEVSTSWLAREREAHREVVVSVVRAHALPRRELLSELAADQQLLAARRVPGVVPVLAHRWLTDGSLAIVRPRIRGASLRELLQATGALSLERAVDVLREVGERLDAARRMGLVHRELSAESICFQQGDGRVLVSFGLPQAVGDVPEPEARRTVSREPMLARCSDTATLGRLAWEMLTTRPAPTHDDVGAMSTRRGYREPGLADLRPDLPLSVAADVESALRCERDQSPKGPMAFVASLAATAGLGSGEPRDDRTTWSVPDDRDRVPPTPIGESAPRRRGAGALAVAMLAVLLLVGGAIYLNRRDDARARTAHRTGPDTGRVATGDVAFDRTRVDTGALTVPAQPTDVMPSTPSRPPAAGATSAVTAPVRPQPAPAPFTPPATCASEANDDQRNCLDAYIERDDKPLTASYEALTRALGDDSAQAARLEAEQRAWLAMRDAECRNDVPRYGIWAPDFARCLRAHSEARTRALDEELQRVQSRR